MEKKDIQHLCTELSGINSSLHNINQLLEEICGQFAQVNNSSSLNGKPFWSSQPISESLHNIAIHLGELSGAEKKLDDDLFYYNSEADSIQLSLEKIAVALEKK